MGKKGCGKSTLLQYYATKYIKKGWTVYSSSNDCNVSGIIHIEPNRLWEYQYQDEKSLVLIDEVNLLWDNRDFKKFPPELGQWLRLQRHYKVKVIMFSQTTDTDKKIRDLTDNICLVKRLLNVFIVSIPYEKYITFQQGTEYKNAEFVESYKLSGLPTVVILPNWIKKFDSFTHTQSNIKKEKKTDKPSDQFGRREKTA